MPRKKTYYINHEDQKVYFKTCQHCGRDFSKEVRALFKKTKWCSDTCKQRAYLVRKEESSIKKP